jgi:S-adenosylmethionine-diacylgycerolhomoserine-N-methlytransferase
MIPAWRLVMDNAVSRLAPGGELHIVDFGNQAGLPRWFRAVLRRWLALFHVTPRDTLQAELIRIAQRTGANVTVSRPYRDYAQLARLSLG